MRTNYNYKVLLLLYLVIVSCNVRKNEDFAIISAEARSLQNKLILSKAPLTKKVVEDLINTSSVDGIIRWEVSESSRFLIKSKSMHTVRATSAEKRFWYIDHEFSIVRLPY